MANDKNFINWAKLVEYPVYNASVMKPNPSYDYSIIGVTKGEIITPDSVYENTTVNDNTFDIRLYARKYESISQVTSLNKEEFTQIMYECVKSTPRKYVWEHPTFDSIFNNSILGLCNKLNDSKVGDELYVRSGRPYILSSGTGLIYDDDVVRGAFSGLVLTVSAKNSIANDLIYTINIPKLIYASNISNLPNATFVYSDATNNIKISFKGSDISKAGDIYVGEIKGIKNITISKVDSGVNAMRICDGSADELTNKALSVPLTKFDFRLEGIQIGTSKKTNKSQIKTERILNRLSKIGEAN